LECLGGLDRLLKALNTIHLGTPAGSVLSPINSFLLTGVGQKVAATALASQTQFVHGTTFCGPRRRARQVDQSVRFRTTILLAILFDEVKIRQPLARNRQITRVAPNGQGEIHTASLVMCRASVFLVCPNKQYEV
jgi:hypothetical protein